MGIWNTLISWVEQLLSFLYGVTHNYGLAIIILTLIIRAIMYPLMQKQMVAMRDTQKIQPLMQEIQKKYSHDKERMNQEIMSLYKQHKVNPMGGCLPLLIQMPILILFFRVLREFKYYIPNTEIVDSTFLWIKDLAGPDQLFGVIGNYSIGILPILVGVSMFVQQKLTMPPMPATSKSKGSGNPAADTQKIMGTVMPLMIAFISFSLPSGLSLYWITSTLFDIGQKLIINKKDHETEIKLESDSSPEKAVTEKRQEQRQEQKKEIEIKPKVREEEISWIPGYEKPTRKTKN